MKGGRDKVYRKKITIKLQYISKNKADALLSLLSNLFELLRTSSAYRGLKMIGFSVEDDE